MRGVIVRVGTLALLVVAGCDTATETPSKATEGQLADGAKRIVSIQSSARPEDLQRAGESAVEARDRRISQILAMYPELKDNPSLMLYFRGELGSTVMVGLGERYAQAAALIAEIGELNSRIPSSSGGDDAQNR
jgi:hypothetical protein